MPDEAQLKAQMQAAIAKKKQQTDQKPSIPNEPKPIEKQDTPIEVKIEPTPAEPPKPATPTSEVAPTSHDRRSPVIEQTPITLTFFGQNIRYTTHRGEVYFAMDDILPLSNDPESQNKYIEFKNQPSTRAKADMLIKNLAFTGENGTEKLDGSTAPHVINVLSQLKLSAPGPLSRWLDEISAQFKPSEDTSEE